MTLKPRIIADIAIPFLKGVLEPFVEVSYLQGNAIKKDTIRDADALIIRTRTKCNESLLHGTNVRFIATATIGTDHIDKEYCKNNGIKWVNAPGCNSNSVNQYIAVALILLSRHFNFSLRNKTLGVVGHGNVGSKVANLAAILGMDVLINDPPKAQVAGGDHYVSLETIQEKADIISFHVPLTRSGKYKTFRMGNEAFVRGCKPKVVLINSSRGEVLDTKKILEAFKNGHVMAYIFDVWENEPQIDPEVLKHAFISTPHIAGYSADGKANGTSVCVDEISKFFGLDIHPWYPDYIPEPENPHLQADLNVDNNYSILENLIVETYDLMGESNYLKNHLDSFEAQRSNYPVRREFDSFYIDIPKKRHTLVRKIKDAGFSIRLGV